MTDRVFSVPTFTPTAVNDTTAMTNATYMTVTAGTALQGAMVKEIYVGGQATVSTVNQMLFARNSTVATTPTALAAPNSDGPKGGFYGAPTTAFKCHVAAATGGSRSATTTNPRLNLSHNAFGGIVKWLAPSFLEGWMVFGVTADISESSLSCLTNGGGAVGAHIVYEIM